MIHTNNKLLNIINKKLGSNYIFQDYIFLIEKSRIHTCHRDNNGKMYNKNQSYPSYTLLIYIDKIENCLDIIPNSNKNKNNIFITDVTLTIKCNRGNVVIFDADIIHSGSFNKNPNNKRIQMKLIHKDDIDILNFYDKYNKKLDKDNNLPSYITNIQKHLSCQFPIISDALHPLINNNYNSNNDISFHEKIFSQIFYGDKNYYNL
jgi:hypothetical protein